MYRLEERLEERLIGKSYTKKEIVNIVSEEIGIKVKTSQAKLVRESGCDYCFSIDKQIGDSVDAYIEIYFRLTKERGVYNVTEVDVDINDWGD